MITCRIFGVVPLRRGELGGNRLSNNSGEIRGPKETFRPEAVLFA